MTPASPAAGAARTAGGGQPPPADEPPPPRKLYRSADGRLVGGVARGLAGHLGLPASWVRIVFAALVMFHGLGFVLYAAFWFVVPLGRGGVGKGGVGMGGVGMGRTNNSAPTGSGTTGTTSPTGTAPDDQSHAWDTGALKGPDGTRRRFTRRADKGQLFAVLVLFAGGTVLAKNLRFDESSTYMIPVALMGLGVVLFWRQADDARRAHWAEVGRRSPLLPLVRGAAGVLLVVAGVSGIVVVQGSAGQAGRVLQAALAVLIGAALLAGPYLVRMTQDLSEERLMRIRAQERAEVAAHVHDSVLHTLTLIQRGADSPREVVRLARAQERELRAWLYRPQGDGKEEESRPQTLAEAVRASAAEVEDHHGVPVEVVCVADCPLDEKLNAQIQAAREAMVNAAKYGGEGGTVQVYAEVEGRRVFVSVRDRGPGFDIDAIPEDRMGVRESVIGRMRRNGGTARVRSAPGEGTEVELEMERAAES